MGLVRAVECSCDCIVSWNFKHIVNIKTIRGVRAITNLKGYKPISPDFTIEDIHKIREYNYSITRDMTMQEKLDYYNKGGEEVHRILQEMKKKE